MILREILYNDATIQYSDKHILYMTHGLYNDAQILHRDKHIVHKTQYNRTQ